MDDDIAEGCAPEALAAWLAAHVPGCDGPVTLEKFAQGQSNPTYLVRSGLVRSGERRFVLRAKPPGPLLPSAHQVEREYRVMRALAGTGVPVPRVLALAGDDASPIGRGFFVMAHVEGRIFFDPALPGMAPAERAAIYDAMNVVLARLHGVDPAAVGLADFGRPGGYFARQTARWAAQYRASVPEPLPAMERIMAWLEAHCPEDDGQVALVHGDWRLDNMIFHPDRPEVVAVLDWELSTLGHPLADLAYQCMQWRLPHTSGMRGLGGLDRAALGLPDEAAYVAAYAARRGWDGVPHWRFALVFAFFRLAAILAGVAARAEAGNASNPETARAYGRAVPELADMAVRVMVGEHE